MVQHCQKETMPKHVEYISVKGKTKGILNWLRKTRLGILTLTNGFLNEEHWGHPNKYCWVGIYSLLDDASWRHQYDEHPGYLPLEVNPKSSK